MIAFSPDSRRAPASSLFARSTAHFLGGYATRILQVPLYFFYLLPFASLAAYFQDTGRSEAASDIARVVFFGLITPSGEFTLGLWPEALATLAMWLVVVQLLATVFGEIGKRNRFVAWLPFLLLVIVYAAPALLFARTGYGASYLPALLGLLFLCGAGVLVAYGSLGRFFTKFGKAAVGMLSRIAKGAKKKLRRSRSGS